MRRSYLVLVVFDVHFLFNLLCVSFALADLQLINCSC